MNKLISVVLTCLMLAFVSLSGCNEEITQNDEPNMDEEFMNVYIDDDYDDTIPGWGVNYFNTIQDGINKVSDGGTVHISKGIYYDNLEIRKSINLIGDDKETTIIDGRNKWWVVKIEVDNCTIQNLNIINSGTDAGVKILANGATLTNNIINGNKYGIWIEGPSEANAFSNNVMDNNIISNNENGIRLFNAKNAQIINNQILLNDEGGIILDKSPYATITDNIFEGNGIIITGSLKFWNSHEIENNTENDKYIYYYKNEKAITVPYDAYQVILANCSDFEIKNNNFENTMIGVLMGFCSNVRIESNNFQSNNLSAIKLYSSNNNTICSNTINNGNGIDFSKSEKNTIEENSIGYTGDSILFSTSNYNNIIANDIFSSSDYGIYFQFSSGNNEVSRNRIYNNRIGCRIKGSRSNNVFRNEFENNYEKGLYICCGAQKNVIYNNSFISNIEHVDYTVSKVNYFFKDGFGNYWDDYLERYPTATQINGFWEFPYQIPGSNFLDEYPLVEQVDI